MKNLFFHFLKSYKNAIIEMALCPTPLCLLLFGFPFLGPFLYFMTFYDPLQSRFDGLDFVNNLN